MISGLEWLDRFDTLKEADSMPVSVSLRPVSACQCATVAASPFAHSNSKPRGFYNKFGKKKESFEREWPRGRGEICASCSNP